MIPNKTIPDPVPAIQQTAKLHRTKPADERTDVMKVFHALLAVFLWPGDVVRKRLGIRIEEDGGIIRSFVNMVVWGGVCLFVVFYFFK